MRSVESATDFLTVMVVGPFAAIYGKLSRMDPATGVLRVMDQATFYALSAIWWLLLGLLVGSIVVHL